MQKWSCRNPLTLQDRIEIQRGIDQGLSSREIGKLIDRDKSVIQREVKRLGDFSSYDAEKAQIHFESIQHQSWKKIRNTLKKRNDKTLKK